ncbi:hypothetical protein FNF29_06633 [Cafeteria roenbergensis]|uniref:HECT domain-containing protein n=2 Tax=Cafeteria roenbergensis TaxID=33653 RepID=A0A5A8C6G0_CAFRO|nr:hypothetical protein FNF29_06633 [Cafeteria roenbergensis]|eukprot:KAA0148415.1 hypothetical protein FNF29_06633 [Cafeteria roenbergensis]
MLGALLDAALTPVELPGFVSRRSVEQIALVTAQRCAEATAWGGVEFQAARAATRPDAVGLAVLASKPTDTADDMSEAIASRWQLAESISRMVMREARLCFAALEEHGDNGDVALEWLMRTERDVDAMSELERMRQRRLGGGRVASDMGSDEATLEGVRFGAPLIDPNAVVGITAADAAATADDDGADDAADTTPKAGAGDGETLSSSAVAEAVLLAPLEALRGEARAWADCGLPLGTPVVVVAKRVGDGVAKRPLGQTVRGIDGLGQTGTVCAAPLGVSPNAQTAWVRIHDPATGGGVCVSVARKRLTVLAGLFGRDLCSGVDSTLRRDQMAELGSLGLASASGTARKSPPATWAAGLNLAWAAALPAAKAVAVPPAAVGAVSDTATATACAGAMKSWHVLGGDSLVGPMRVLAMSTADAERAAASHAARLAAVLLLLAWPRDMPFRLEAAQGAKRLILATRVIVGSAVSGSGATGDLASVSSGQLAPDGEASAESAAARPGVSAGRGGDDGGTGSVEAGWSSVSGASSAAPDTGVLVKALRSKLSALIRQEDGPAASAQAAAATWICRTCGLRNPCGDAPCTACRASRPAEALDTELLSAALIADCAASITDATRSMTESARHASWAQELQSAHPMRQGVEHLRVEVKGASALFVTFSRLCHTPTNDPGAFISFFADEQLTRLVATRQGPSHAFRPFLAPVNRLFVVVRRSSGLPVLQAKETYGLRCQVRGLRGVCWSGEADIRREPSLEWGCWLLSFLVREALPATTLRAGALHTGDMVSAMVRFLRTPNAPFKPTVFTLLNSILACPQYFSTTSPPDLTPFGAMSAQAVRMLGVLSKAEQLFPPVQLQHALETAAAAQAAGELYGGPYFCPIDVSGLAGSATSALWTPSSDPASWHPPIATGSVLAAVSLSSVPSLQALVYLRELIKPLATAVHCLPDSPRLGRVPDPWMARAVADARGGGTTHVSAGQLIAAHRAMAMWTREMDEELVAWLSQLAIRDERSVPDLRPSAIPLGSRERAAFTVLAITDDDDIRLRFSLLRIFNRLIARCLGLFDTTGALGPASVGGLLRSTSHLVFADTKQTLVRNAVEATKRKTTMGAVVVVSAEDAAASLAAGHSKPDTSRCEFVQVSDQLARVRSASLRCNLDDKDRLFEVRIRGQEGIDWGGVFRGTLSNMCEDLFPPPSRQAGVELFTRSPKSALEPGVEDEFVPCLARIGKRAASQYKFVGVMMGISLRYSLTLDIRLAPLVWKLVAGDPVGSADLATVDPATAKLLQSILDARPEPPAAAGIAAAPASSATTAAGAAAQLAELLADGAAIGDSEHAEEALAGMDAVDAAFVRRFNGLTFVDSLNGGDGAPLVQGGERRLVLPSNRHVFVDLMVRRRARRYVPASRLMCRGLMTMIPARILPILGGADLRTAVCGAEVIDIGILKAHSEYGRPFDARHPTVCQFWTVMEELTNAERQRVIRYAWGRSKLPHGAEAWRDASGRPVTFKLYPFYRHPPIMRGDESLVEAHTCFFQLKVPQYSSVDVLRERLRRSVTEGLASGFHIA